MKKFLPTLLVLFTLIGMLAGICIASGGQKTIIISQGGASKIDELMQLMRYNYVDSLNVDEIIEETMPKILNGLDPHSRYIPADEMEATNADLASSFSGIGIRFTIQEDTVNITDVIRGGPSEQIGLMAGDCIVKVNDTLFVGEVCTNDNAMKKLKGPKGTTVKVSVKRYGEKDLLHFNIVRGDIPMESIEAAYLIDGKWGYIQVERFAEKTFAEFIISLAKFLQTGCRGLIIDVRGNGGGYMGVAIQMANEFLHKGDIIVYTEGVNSPRSIERANGRGNFPNIPLVILTDETSASASEILAGAIQDNDRGTIIGRRTFGKGLVQQPHEFSDGSAVRLTIARYYTPSGRCIQKPYTKGENDEYAKDIIYRYERGEFFSRDSIHENDTLVYQTSMGRTVHGGGGIMPDIFVSSDTTRFTPYYSAVTTKRLPAMFTMKYCKEHRHELEKFKTHKAMTDYIAKLSLIDKFIAYATDKGVPAPKEKIVATREILQQSLNSHIIYNILGMQEYVKYMNLSDPTVLRAVEVLEAGKAFPQVPEKK